MQRSISKKVLIALVFAVFMAGFFWITAINNPASAITVTVQAEGPNNNFLLTPREVTVTAGYAESFTGGVYTNNSPATSSNVTVMDVLFKAHKDLYGDNFNSTTYGQYIGGESTSYLNKIFGFQGGTGYDFPALMFVVNGIQPRDEDPTHSFPAWGSQGATTGYMTYAMNQAIVSQGDVINFFYIKSYHDQYAYLEDDYDSYLSSNPLEHVFSVSDTIYLKGYDVFSEGWMDQSGWTITDLAYADICRVSDGYVVGSADENGTVDLSTLNLSAGYNYLTIKSSDVDTLGYYVPPYFIVQNGSN